MKTNQRQALERLIAIAKKDADQCRRVANFLLSWFNGPVCGGWDVTDVWHLQTDIREDVLVVLAFISEQTIYPETLGYSDEFQVIARQWHPSFFIPENEEKNND